MGDEALCWHYKSPTKQWVWEYNRSRSGDKGVLRQELCSECEITEGTWYKVGQEMNVTSQLLSAHNSAGRSPTHVSDCSDMGGSMATPWWRCDKAGARRSVKHRVLTLLLTAGLFKEHRQADSVSTSSTVSWIHHICKYLLYIKLYLEQRGDYKYRNKTLRFETRISRHELCCDDDL